jgi:hypothetical protein
MDFTILIDWPHENAEGSKFFQRLSVSGIRIPNLTFEGNANMLVSKTLKYSALRHDILLLRNQVLKNMQLGSAITSLKVKFPDMRNISYYEIKKPNGNSISLSIFSDVAKEVMAKELRRSEFWNTIVEPRFNPFWVMTANKLISKYIQDKNGMGECCRQVALGPQQHGQSHVALRDNTRKSFTSVGCAFAGLHLG